MKEITMKNILGKEIFLGGESLQRFLAEVRVRSSSNTRIDTRTPAGCGTG